MVESLVFSLVIMVIPIHFMYYSPPLPDEDLKQQTSSSDSSDSDSEGMESNKLFIHSLDTEVFRLVVH